MHGAWVVFTAGAMASSAALASAMNLEDLEDNAWSVGNQARNSQSPSWLMRDVSPGLGYC